MSEKRGEIEKRISSQNVYATFPMKTSKETGKSPETAGLILFWEVEK